ncbi:nucleoside hydrolase [Actinoplanes sp. CA-142083]|uniref:nucleoside hydrolase n=1 Tax=Actinoplanes sp. CA-142083 TaxID=3239903 RepID=UPI003D91C4E0
MRLVGITVVVVLVAFAGAAPAQARPRDAIPVIYDSDMDFDDASTLAYLCEEHKLGRIDLRAVTVAEDGFGVPSRTLRHAHSVLAQCGLPGVPIAAGAAGEGVHPAPAELVATIETVLSGALGDGDLPPVVSELTATELIARTARRSPVTILATGPLTNVAAALADPRTSRRITKVQLMGGALHVPGNLYGSALPGYDNSQEFNMWMDPASARDVLRRAAIRMVPLDATAAVPITQDYIARIGADQQAPGARIVHRIATQPDLAALIDLGIMYWWDALAAVSLAHDDVTTFRPSRIDVVQEGVQSGRTVVTPHGYPVRAAQEADRAAFEQRFLDSLNGRR